MKTEKSIQSMTNQTSLSHLNKESSTLPKSRAKILRIQTWLISYIAKNLEIESQQIEIDVPFKRYGLDSSATVMITADLSDWLGQKLEPTLAYKYPTIEALSKYLATEDTN